MHSLVRSGLYEELQIHLRHVLQRRGPKVVYAVGHSLGAAMAAIAAPMLRVKLHLDDVRLWTFGSPRVGNSVRGAHSPMAVTSSHRRQTARSPLAACRTLMALWRTT